MAGFILCKSKYADKPYYISNMSINIYSTEELCYYIYNNIYLIGTDLFDNGLIEYLDKELKETDLAKQLEFLLSQKAGLSELVITVLRYVDYYSEDEIMSLKDIIDKLDVQNVSERLKARADNFLTNSRFYSALKNYELIVYGTRDKTLPAEFYGKVWHNMGTAYAKMFCFSEASVCFKIAYEMDNDEESQKEYFASLCLDRGEMLNEDSEELLYVTYREIETLMDHASMEEECQEINNASDLKQGGRISEYYEALDDILDQWKEDYRFYTK